MLFLRVCPEASIATPVRDKRWGDSKSDLVLLTLTVLGKIISVPKHLQAGESKEIPGEKR